jgi:hypothetical protein
MRITQIKNMIKCPLDEMILASGNRTNDLKKNMEKEESTCRGFYVTLA